MKTYVLPVVWEVHGTIPIEAENYADFLNKVEGFRDDHHKLNLPEENHYVEESFEVGNDEIIDALNNIKEEQ